MRQKGLNRRASEPSESYPCNYGDHLKRSFPPPFFGWFSSFVVEPGDEKSEYGLAQVFGGTSKRSLARNRPEAQREIASQGDSRR
jgi:hypothetical protein